MATSYHQPDGNGELFWNRSLKPRWDPALHIETRPSTWTTNRLPVGRWGSKNGGWLGLARQTKRKPPNMDDGYIMWYGYMMIYVKNAHHCISLHMECLLFHEKNILNPIKQAMSCFRSTATTQRTGDRGHQHVFLRTVTTESVNHKPHWWNSGAQAGDWCLYI